MTDETKKQSPLEARALVAQERALAEPGVARAETRTVEARGGVVTITAVSYHDTTKPEARLTYEADDKATPLELTLRDDGSVTFDVLPDAVDLEALAQLVDEARVARARVEQLGADYSKDGTESEPSGRDGISAANGEAGERFEPELVSREAEE